MPNKRRKPEKAGKGAKRTKAAQPQSAVVREAVETDRITYRELRNTPGRVWERLADDTPLTLVADGEVKALVIPITDGDTRKALDAYSRGRAMIAMQDIQAEARRNGTSTMTLEEINTIIREVRRQRNS